MRILLVEDDDMLGEAVRDGLRQEGYVVDRVRNAKAALAALSTSSFSALVLDLGLPDSDGWACCAGCARAGRLPRWSS